MIDGYISLHRKILTNELWHKKPFSYGQAWIDLLLLANFRETTFFKRGIEIRVPRGSLAYSVLALSKRWSWSRPKVDLFLQRLVMRNQILHQKNNITSLISIINYETYQGKNCNKPSNKPSNKPCNKNAHLNKDNKDNKDNKINTYVEQVRQVLDFFNITCKKKLTLTKERSNIITNCLNNNITLEDIKIAIVNFSKDTWDDRHKYCDIVYAIGTRNKINNFEKWFNYNSKQKDIKHELPELKY